jgi:integrase
MRVSEALALRWQDVDFEAREVSVRHQLDVGGQPKRPKTKAGVRSIPLLPALDQELRRHRKEQLARGLTGSDQLIFTTVTGKLVSAV